MGHYFYAIGHLILQLSYPSLFLELTAILHWSQQKKKDRINGFKGYSQVSG